MIYIIYGDDSGESRKEFSRLRQVYKEKGIEIHDLTTDRLQELDKWLFESAGLFSQKKAFFGENLLSKKENRELLKKFDTTAADTHIVIWEEETDERTVKYAFKNAKLLAKKLPSTIFKLLDGLTPGNLAGAISLLHQLIQTIDQNIILYMVQRRIRELILIKNNQTPDKKLAAWQIARLKAQARVWKSEDLVNFYEGLYRIEVFAKTSKNYYDIQKALDILLTFYV